jgi:hypothetical protein
MKSPVLLLSTALLVCSVFAGERLGHAPERFKGNVKSVRTRMSTFTRESDQWVKRGEPFEKTEDISDRSIPAGDDVDDSDDDTDAGQSGDGDPIKAKQAEGYNAGYGTSHGGYGFYKVDKADNILEAVHYSSKDDLAGRDFYSYDANGRELEKTTFNANRILLSRRISSYDGDGNRIAETEYSSDGTIPRKTIWTLDSYGNVTQESFFDTGVLTYKLSYSYEYDRVGNWVKRVKVSEGFGSKPGTTMEIAERLILYR